MDARAGLVALVALSACSGSLSAGTRSEAIVAGDDDDGDPAVVALLDGEHAYCSGVLVAPRVVLTAAHCLPLDHALPQVLFGTGVGSDDTRFEVLTATRAPGFDAITLAHDLALLLVAGDAPAAPLPIRTAPLDGGDMTAPVRIVGFGHTGPDGEGTHRKRSGITTLSSIEPATFHTAAARGQQPCLGDSGGPALLAGDDGEEVAGVISSGDAACASFSAYTRVDAWAQLIAEFAAAVQAGASAPGARCWYDEQCRDGDCRAAIDDPALAFCSRACAGDGDCPDGLVCDADGSGARWCLPPAPSPGRDGTVCRFSAECESGVCAALEGVAGRRCARGCVPSANRCAPGFSCVRNLDQTAEVDPYACAPRARGCAFVPTAPAPPPCGVLALALVVFARRRARSILVIGAIAVAVAGALAVRPRHPLEPSPASVAAVVRERTAVPPSPINVSLDGRLLLVRVADAADLRFQVRRLESEQVLTEIRVEDAQLGGRAWRADSAMLAFMTDRGGSADYRLVLIDVPSGRRQEVAHPPTRGGSLRWAPVGTLLAYIEEPDFIERNLMIVDSAHPERGARRLLRGLAKKTSFAWSADGRRIVTATRAGDGTIVEVAVDEGRVRALAAGAAGAEMRSFAWDPDDTATLTTLRNPSDEYFSLWRIARAGGRPTELVAAPGDISGPLYCPDDRCICYHVGGDEGAELVVRQRDGAETRPLALAGASTVTGFTPAGDRAYVLHRGTDRPAALIDVPLHGGEAPAVVDAPAAAPGLNGERVTLHSADGRDIPAYLWRAAPQPGRARAVLIYVHGAAGQTLLAWDERTQDYLARGFDVLAVDFRGSVGYGASYEHLDGDFAGATADVLAATDFAATALGVPRRQLVLVGGSLGARLALNAVAERPDAVGALVLISLARTAGAGAAPPAGGGRFAGALIAVHGSEDHPEAARELIVSTLGPASLQGATRLWRVFAGEGHYFHRTETWAWLDAAIAKLGGR